MLTHFLLFTIHIRLSLNIWIGRCVYKSVRNLLTASSWQDRSFFSSPFSSSAKDRSRFLPLRLPVCVAVPDFVSVFGVKFMCMFSSTCLKGIFHITAFYVWLNVHTKGREWRPWPSGVTQTIQAVYADGQRHKDSPRNPKAGGPDCTMMPCREPALAQPDWRESLDSRQTPLRAKGTIYCTSIGHVPRPSRCKYLNLSFRLIQFQPCASQKRRPFKPSHQRNRSYSHFTALHQLNEVSKKDVSVPLAETLSVIGHLRQRRRERKRP